MTTKPYDAIGGYFGFEENLCPAGRFSPGHFVDCGRSALYLILNQQQSNKVYLPFFSCHVVLAVLRRLNIDWEFLPLNSNFEIEEIPSLKRNELLLYVDFFGLKGTYARELSRVLGEKVIIDSTQAFFSKGYKKSWSFNSLRKFFGVPDGAQIFYPEEKDLDLGKWEENSTYRFEHLTKRFEGEIEKGYEIFKKNEALIWSHRSCHRISKMTFTLFSQIDFDWVREKRISNFYSLHKALGSINQLPADLFLDPNAVPFSYPYLPSDPIPHEKLWARNLFVPVLWPECFTNQERFYLENEWASKIIHFPIDHRYGEEDMLRILSIVEEVG